jgi:hypothetical protein
VSLSSVVSTKFVPSLKMYLTMEPSESVEALASSVIARGASPVDGLALRIEVGGRRGLSPIIVIFLRAIA